MISQIVAAVIFVVMFILIVVDKIERHYVTLGCGVLTLGLVMGICMQSGEAVVETLNFGSIITPEFWYHTGNSAESAPGINWETIIFIAGMMIMVEGMARVGFFRWLTGIVKEGNFGTSVTVDPGKPVTDLIRERLGVTISLNFWAIVFTYLLAIPAGVATAGREGTIFDRSVEISMFILYSLPVMWAGLLLQSLFCEGGTFPIFPLKGISPDNPDNLSIWQLQLETLRCYFLPVLCLTYGGFAGLSRYTRSSMLEVLRSDYIRTARAKGLTEKVVIYSHAWRNALIPIVSLVIGWFLGIFGGSLVIESMFALNGMGKLMIDALRNADYDLVLFMQLFYVAMSLLGNLIVDLVYGLVDPRVRVDK